MNGNTSRNPLKLFVAMPYSSLGPNAKWPIKHVFTFYEHVRKRIESVMNRPVEIRFEKDAPKSGFVVGEMFEAIRDADIFIADITGSNGNVLLELGVRYGVSDKVTILTTQEDGQPLFDINQIAAVRYANGPTQDAEDRIAEIVRRELDTDRSGSPILKLLGSKVVSRQQWDICSGERIGLIIQEALNLSDSSKRLALLRSAVEIDPYSLDAQTALLEGLRGEGELDAALAANEDAIRRFPHSALILKERGRILDRLSSLGEDRLEEAIEAFTQALQLKPGDGDLHGCLGGVLRRKALRCKSNSSAALLDRAFHHYSRCQEADRHSTYAGMNLMRLMLLGAKSGDRSGGSEAEYLTRMFHLCSFEVSDSMCREHTEKWWPMFDLGDILLFQNETQQALEKYREAIAVMPVNSGRDQLLSPLRTWTELIEYGSLNKRMIANAEQAIALLESELAKLKTVNR